MTTSVITMYDYLSYQSACTPHSLTIDSAFIPPTCCGYTSIVVPGLCKDALQEAKTLVARPETASGRAEGRNANTPLTEQLDRQHNSCCVPTFLSVNCRDCFNEVLSEFCVGLVGTYTNTDAQSLQNGFLTS